MKTCTAKVTGSLYKQNQAHEMLGFVEKSYDGSTGYNFLSKLIIALLLDFRKQ